MRYLQGTKSVGLRFRSCDNDADIIAYTDANFGVKRSQSGSVIKLGDMSSRGDHQSNQSGVLNVESEVHACAATSNLADYIRTLRELCLPTPNMQLRWFMEDQVGS